LRGALARAQGKVLVGIIGSIGKRRDAEAMVALEKLRNVDDWMRPAPPVSRWGDSCEIQLSHAVGRPRDRRCDGRCF
jgi:hypothetical protein